MIFAIARLGPLSPAGALLAAAGSATLTALVLLGAPLLIFWAVPLSMYTLYYGPLMPYEAVLLILASAMLLPQVPRWRARQWRLPQLEARYLIFLATVLPGALAAVSLWSYTGAIKILIFGLIGFEVARAGARRFGYEAMSWGPALFLAVSSAVLGARSVTGSVSLVKSGIMRAYFSDLPWGTSNAIAAVVVLCMPALVLLVRVSPAFGMRRIAGMAILAGTVGALLVTTSRGGFALTAAYLLTLAVRGRRTPALGVLGLGALAVALIVTPFGKALLDRFVNPASWISVSFRIATWQLAFERGMHHLPFGVGAGQGVHQNDRMLTVDPHNYLLTLFSESGPLAVACWAWLIVSLWSIGRRLRRSPSTALLGTMLRDTMVIALLNMLFEPTFKGGLYHLLFWWLTGTFVGAGETGRDVASVPVTSTTPTLETPADAAARTTTRS
jgi:hypothetical protein